MNYFSISSNFLETNVGNNSKFDEMTLQADAKSISHVPRRRNGRPQACEPCHRRKVACDHTLPFCSRCKRGGITEKCVYITNRSNHTRLKVSRQIPLQTPPQEFRLSPETSQDNRHSDASSQVASPTDGLQETSIGYMGATSFSAVLLEAQDKLQSMRGPQYHQEFLVAKSPDKCRAGECHKPSDVAINILLNIPDKASSYYLFQSVTKLRDGWSRLATERLLDSLWDTFGDVLDTDNRDLGRLAEIAVKLCENSSVRLRENHKDPEEWFREFSGKNFRWESMGILYHAWADGLLRDNFPEPPHVCVSLRGQDRMEIVMCYKNSAWNCVQFCWSNSSGSTLLAFLLYRQGTIETCVGGDTDIRPWRLHGDCVSLTTYLGLHVSPQEEYDRSISVQIKRRLFAAVFSNDKSDATFTGRPPMLSRRFCSSPLPMDISDEELLQLPPYHEGKASTFDQYGWNTDGQLRSTTFLRARALLAFIRDPILEMSLRTPSEGCEQTLLDLRRREMEQVAQFPPVLTYRVGVMCSDIPKMNIAAKMHIQLEHLQNLFFIERLLSKLPNCEPGKLLEVSLDLIALSLVPWKNQKRLQKTVCQVQWIILCYGGPAAGVVCLELLRPSAASMGPNGVKRSSMIKQLSMLVGALDWVSSGPPNAEVCESIKHVVEQVLDKVLDMPEDPSNGTDNSGGFGMDLSTDMNDLFNLDLLDTFDWLRPE